MKITFKTVFWAVLAIIFGIIIASLAGKVFNIAYSFASSHLADNTRTNLVANTYIPETIPEPEQPKITTLTFVGDIMLDRGVETSVVKNFGGDFSPLFDNLITWLSENKTDILFGNLEGPVSDQGADRHDRYSFRMSPLVLPALNYAGFNILSLANNHVGNWGRVAFDDTLVRLNENNLTFIGGGVDKTEASTPKITEVNGLKIGWLAFTDVNADSILATDKQSGILSASDPDRNQIIADAKSAVDILIVSFHFGEEYKPIHNKRQAKLAHEAIDAGADIIIGGHSHVIEDTEFYNNGFIAYSLGNFIFDQSFSSPTMSGMLLQIKLQDKSIIEINQYTTKLDKLFRVESIEPYVAPAPKEFSVKEKSPCPEGTDDSSSLYLTDINKDGLAKDFVPANLKPINKTGKIICLEATALTNLKNMAMGAKKSGLTISVTSGFRTYETQNTLYKNQTQVNIKSVASAGKSEHQLGTAVDLTGSSVNYLSATALFTDSPEAIWLENNAYKYGFIQSYPEDKESVTGYIYEPWHYRYVGLEAAKTIYTKGETLAEYLSEENTI